MTPDERSAQEERAIANLSQAHTAMTRAAGDDPTKKLYAEEMLDILRRLRGDHGS